MATQIFEATIDENGVPQFAEPLRLPQGTKVTLHVTELPKATEAFEVKLTPGTVYHIASPRLVDQGQTYQFVMEVTEVSDSVRL